METGKSTTTGVLFWTPAPVRTSSTSSVISEDVWKDEDEEQAEKDDDFVNQMDENGIIGLSEALEDVELGETDAECDPNLYPEETDFRRQERNTSPEELSYNLSEHLSNTESLGRNVQLLSPFDDLIGSLTAQTLDEEVRQRRSTSRELGSTNGVVESYISKGETEKISSTAMELAGVSNHHCPISQPASHVTAPTFPHLLHFTAEEIAAAPGIEAETFPEMSSIESLPESHRSHMSSHVSLKSSPFPEIKLKALQPEATFSEEVMSDHYSRVSTGPLNGSDKSHKPHKQPTPSPRKTRLPSPEVTYSPCSLSRVKDDSLKFKHQTTSPDRELKRPPARSNAAELDESRKGPLSYRTPDFSKVGPRVHFPKGGYKPPKSRCSSKRESLSPEPPLMFKSPADIVKEVLLNTTDGSPAPLDSYRPPANAPDSIVPEEFRCRRNATTLLEQLQEDYKTLLTKYAEAENTIDRLRLEGKVNLYSDPPKPGHSVQSGMNQEASRIMMLDFPQAQRAVINSNSLHSNGHSNHQRNSSANSSTRSPDPLVGQQPAKILYSQADRFLQQLQTFEDLLKCKKLKPFEQVKGLPQLAEGLDSLERGYLLARDEHKLLQQRGVQISNFDPERELEGLIFQCGLRMDELKEQVEQMQQEQPTCEGPPSTPPHSTPSLVSSERRETLTHPQSPPVPLLLDAGEAAAVEVSSASEESDEETLNSLYLKPPNGKNRRVEQDFAKLMDDYQSFKELPKLLDHSQKDGALISAAVRTDKHPGDENKGRLSQGTGNLEVQRSRSQTKSDCQDFPPVRTSKQQTSRSSRPSRRASSQSTTLPVHPTSSKRRLELGKSHSSSLSSLGEITALERRNSKLQPARSRVLSQDGIISPETDSGFVGSESSRLTPAAAPSPLHQRASERVLMPQEGIPGKPHTGPVSAPSPTSLASHRHTAIEPSRDSRLISDQLRRTRQRQRRRTFSCSPQRWVGQTERSRADSGTSEFGLESDSTHTMSEDGQNDQYTESSNSLHSSSPSSSPTSRRHHGDSLRALSSSQVANRNEAIQTLQAEVDRLKERLESCLRNKKAPSSVRAAPSTQENYTRHITSTPHVRSGERCSDVSRERRDRPTVDEVEESTLRRTTRKRPPSAHRRPQPDILTTSEPSTPQTQPLVSRCTQTSTTAPDSHSSCTKTVRSRNPRQHPGVTADEPDSRSHQAPLCPQCLSRRQGRPKGGGNIEPTHSSLCRHCPLCGCPEPFRSTEPDCRRVSDSPPHTSCQPESPDGVMRSRYFAAAAPPTLLQCMPVCPPPLLLYSSPLYVSPSNRTGTSSRVRGREEARGRSRRSLSADKQRSVDSSLNRAIRAARHMKNTSGHMARSLAAGLHYQELLTQSCSY
ncbi:microtubule organization protein AKNA isoform X1 [Dicentrarchus labrax]|uniref:AT-hook transcription factor n=1 Tax=Dicentrarchus labrax TaxID=13489 RepID=A0A8C4H0E9_DICLA|nr:microtubule organization protein AKNA isoform X1 [Dicentrarchus labrax]XP_051267621.1 microtubule organization protein AKNA isoform X1 [Dicentrarchus labrax]XP_051267622.1 microtubule organization protein AKNA isoform X1 [Dicentrarchus labrax]